MNDTREQLDFRFDLAFPRLRRASSFALSVRPFTSGLELLSEDTDFDVFALADMLERREQAGFVFTCSCGIPECGGWEKATIEVHGSQLFIANEQLPPMQIGIAEAHSLISDARRLTDALGDTSIDDLLKAGVTPLAWAVQQGEARLVADLIACGHDTNRRDRGRRAPLHHAVEKRDVHLVTLLLDGGAVASIPDAEGWTPLHEAIDVSGLDLVEKLVKAGANVDQRNKFGQTAFHRAARGEEIEIAAYLAHAGARIFRDARGQTPIDVCNDRGGNPTLLAVLEACPWPKPDMNSDALDADAEHARLRGMSFKVVAKQGQGKKWQSIGNLVEDLAEAVALANKVVTWESGVFTAGPEELAGFLYWSSREPALFNSCVIYHQVS